MKNHQHIPLFLALSLLFSVFGTNAQTVSTDKNAVIHSKYRTASSSSAIATDASQTQITINYLDGLGRAEQGIAHKQSPLQKDISTQTQLYDTYGRPIKQILPGVSTSTNGAFQTNAQSLANSFYGDNNAYTETVLFDNSPLNRVQEQYGAGQAWRTASKKTQVFYEAAGNQTRRYVVDGSGNINIVGTYPNGVLLKMRTVDEQGHTTVELKDRLDRVIEKWVQDDSGFMVTHYVYDSFRRLRAIIQPQGYTLNSGFSYNGSDYQNYVFAYEYDSENRIARKHIPSGGWSSFVYDKADRPVLEQTALQAQSSKWSFTKYDVFGRVIITGELTNPNSRSTLQGYFDGIATPYETWNGSTYTAQSYPISYNATDEKAWQFYDQYNWIASDWAFNNSTAYNASSYYANATGLPTGGWSRDPENPSIVYHSVTYYDNKGRILQTHQVHQKGGAVRWSKPIRTDYEYNFAGEVTKEKKTYKIDGEADRTKVKSYTYDHTGRKTAYDLNLGNINERLTNYEFDEIGRLSRKVFLPNGNFTYGGAKDYIIRPTTDGAVTQPNSQDIARKAVVLEPINNINALNITSYTATIDPNAPIGVPIIGLQKINYTYHIRGGLLGINLDASKNPNLAASEADLFSYKLDYETTGQWDGNIGKETWKSAKNTGTNRSYSYFYDPAKRLKSATYSGGMFTNENYNIENINYDKNGNIQTFWRKGMTGANGTAFGYTDQMQYFYSGNRLNGITDAINNNIDVSDFRDNGSNNDYTYWADGSLKSDANRGISLIEWDTFLKKIKQITYGNGNWIKYFYDGGGNKIKMTDSEGTVWEYIGKDLIYKNGTLYQINDDEGRILYENGSYVYEFNYKDHLGNIRVSFKAVGNQLIETQENAYYPFGLAHTGTDFTLGVNANNFQYNGKEKINSFGLNYSDYGFRTHDLLTNRFISVDPLGESFAHNGVYNYAENAPIMNVDLDGLEKLKSISPEGKPEYESGLDRPKTRIINATSSTSQNSSSGGFFQDVLDMFSFKNGIQIYGSGGVKNSDDFGATKREIEGKINVMDLGKGNEIYGLVTLFLSTTGKTPEYAGLISRMIDELAIEHPISSSSSFYESNTKGVFYNKNDKEFMVIDEKGNIKVDEKGKVILDRKVYIPYYEYTNNGTEREGRIRQTTREKLIKENEK